MFHNKLTPGRLDILGWVFVGSILVSTGFAQNAQATGSVAATPSPAAPASSTATRKVSPYRPTSLPTKARDSYELKWGVDSLGVKSVESGLMIRFSYRVVNAAKAQTLNDKKASPYLLDQRTHAKLVVPTLEKVGQLRQSGAPEVGKAYWMVFSNKGNFVKRGDPVSVVIGKFRVDGLVVE
jgi:hypothetical protein